jgi:transcriptional regulator GlxA family with amidase domain
MAVTDRVRAGVLAYPGCFGSEVFGVVDLLTISGHVARSARPAAPWFETRVVSPRQRVVAAGEVAIGTGPVGEVDVLVVPGFELSPTLDLDALLAQLRPEIDTIRSHAERGIPVAAICVGAFLLGEAGLLQGRRATTSWLFADRLAVRFPQVEMCVDQLVVNDAGVSTTAGFSAMYDLVLDLVDRYCGAEVARRTAKITLIDAGRSSQSPYVDHDLLPAGGDTFASSVQRWLDQHLQEPYDLGRLAQEHCVSSRTLLRRYKAETGETPLTYLQRARVDRARQLLEVTDLSQSEMLGQVGYSDPSTFARLFVRHVGIGPSAYRAKFGRRGVRRG